MRATAVWGRATAAVLGVAIVAGSASAQPLPRVTARGRLEMLGPGERVGVELRSGSRLFGSIEELQKRRFRLADRPGHSFKVDYEEVVAFLDVDNGAVIAVAVPPPPPAPRVSPDAKILVGIGLACTILAMLVRFLVPYT